MVARIIPAARIVVDQEDKTLDLVCFEYAARVLGDRRRAGKLRGFVEATLDANPGLAAEGAILPLGRVVEIPEFSLAEPEAVGVRLW